MFSQQPMQTVPLDSGIGGVSISNQHQKYAPAKPSNNYSPTPVISGGSLTSSAYRKSNPQVVDSSLAQSPEPQKQTQPPAPIKPEIISPQQKVHTAPVQNSANPSTIDKGIHTPHVQEAIPIRAFSIGSVPTSNSNTPYKFRYSWSGPAAPLPVNSVNPMTAP